MDTVVLIHGAWHGAWCWDEVVAGLDDAGVEHVAVERPFTGHPDDVAAAAAALDGIPGDKVVVGHSYRGLVTSGATEGRTDVTHLVYLCAFLLDKDVSVLDELSDVDLSTNKLLPAMRTTDDGRSCIDPAEAPGAFFNESPPELADAAVARLRPMDPTSTRHPCLGDPWRRVPTTYVVSERDFAIPAEGQRRMAKRAGTILSLDTDHSPFLSKIPETVRIITDRV